MAAQQSVSYKQVILLRKDLKMSLGKACAQVAHASLESALKSGKKLLWQWLNRGGKKVVLAVEGQEQLLECKTLAARAGIANALITDAGRTELSPGTVTCLAIGPDAEEKIDKIAGKLKML